MKYYITIPHKVDHPLFNTYSVVDDQYTYNFDYKDLHKAIDYLLENDIKVGEIFTLPRQA